MPVEPRPGNLDGWNTHLEAHFTQLKQVRAGQPLFVLEHGLDPTEVDALSVRVRNFLPPRPRHNLSWVVYATELGYRYDGNEYWERFERETPRWKDRGDRNFIRDAFEWFHQQYGGIKPSGAWAEHFNIISWPLTHAILPRDLQIAFAETLYRIRHLFDADVLCTPLRLGQLIAEASSDYPDRFREFVKNHLLAGQIAGALLSADRDEPGSGLLQVTVDRLLRDLTREQQAMAWLTAARSAASNQRVHIAARGTRGPAIPGMPVINEEILRALTDRGGEPRLSLAEVAPGAGWDVFLETPDLSPLVDDFPHFGRIIRTQTCAVAGAAGRAMARGRCLDGRQRIRLGIWPEPGQPVLKFTPSDLGLDQLLQLYAVLPPMTKRLFKVRTDRTADQQASLAVRPGSTYLFLSTEGPPQGPLPVATLTCTGVWAVEICVPEFMDPPFEALLKGLGIVPTRSLECWPAGLTAASWNGEFASDWLASETPIFGFRADHAIRAIRLERLGGEVGGDGRSCLIDMDPTDAGEPVFVGFPDLEAGTHRFAVTSARAGGGETVERDAFELMIRIREARAHLKNSSSHGLLELDSDPPSLEDLWSGQFTPSLYAPEGRAITCKAEMVGYVRQQVLFEASFLLPTLPRLRDDWFPFLLRELVDLDGARNVYDDTSHCRISFSADELGMVGLTAYRRHVSLRWSINEDGGGFQLEVHRAEAAGSVSIDHASFNHPAKRSLIPGTGVLTADPLGGLYVATVGQHSASIIVPPIAQGRREATPKPRFEDGDGSLVQFPRLLSRAAHWWEAEFPRDRDIMAWRTQVMRALSRHLFRLVGGDNWFLAEQQTIPLDVMSRLGRHVTGRGVRDDDITSRLHKAVGMLSSLPVGRRVESFRSSLHATGLYRLSLQSNIVVRRIPADAPPKKWEWIAELALRMASNPAIATAWAGEHSDIGLNVLKDNPTVARAARFLVLLVDEARQSHTVEREIYAGWEWPR